MPTPEYGYAWALTLNDRFKQLIADGDHQLLICSESPGSEAKPASPGTDHYMSLLYTPGLKENKYAISFFNDKAIGCSLTMTS